VVIAGRRDERARELARNVMVDAGSLNQSTFKHADLIIEAITEDLPSKIKVLKQLEGWAQNEAIIATNTSSLRLDALAQKLRDASRFVGLHFLNPAELTAVVEVIPGSCTSAKVIGSVCEFVVQIGKKPLLLKHDLPGFIWNRIQFAVLRECLHMLREGIADASSIDAAVADGLAPRWMGAGPLATAQLGGLHTFKRVAEELFPRLANDQDVGSSLDDALFTWDSIHLSRITELRRDALTTGRKFTARRAD